MAMSFPCLVPSDPGVNAPDGGSLWTPQKTAEISTSDVCGCPSRMVSLKHDDTNVRSRMPSRFIPSFTLVGVSGITCAVNGYTRADAKTEVI